MLSPALLTAGGVLLTVFFLIKGLTVGSTSASLFFFAMAAGCGVGLYWSAKSLWVAYKKQQATEAEWSRTGSPFAPKATETVTPSPAPVSAPPAFGRSSFEYDYGRNPAPNSTPSRSNPAARTHTIPTSASRSYGDRHFEPAPQPYAPQPYAPAPAAPQSGMSPMAAGAAGLAVGGIAGYALGSAGAAHAAGGSHGSVGHGAHSGGETWVPRNRDDASLGAPLSGGSSSQPSALSPVTGDQLDAGQVGPGAAAAAAGAVGLGYGSGALDPILGDDLDATTDSSATAPISGDSLWGSASSDPIAPIESADLDVGGNPWSQTAAIDASELGGGFGSGDYEQTAAIDSRDLESGYATSNYAHDYGETAAVESSGFGGFGALEPVSSASIERDEPASNDWGSGSSDYDGGSNSTDFSGGSDDWS